MMDEQKTARLIQAHSVKEFFNFIREHAGNLVHADSLMCRYRGVKTKDCSTTVLLPLSVMFDDRERIGERTRRLLTSKTGQLIASLS